MNDDLALDPSDPLNLLTQNHSQHNTHQTDDDSSPSVGTPSDWNSLSSMWPSEDKMDSRPCPCCPRPGLRAAAAPAPSPPRRLCVPRLSTLTTPPPPTTPPQNSQTASARTQASSSPSRLEVSPNTTRRPLPPRLPPGPRIQHPTWPHPRLPPHPSPRVSHPPPRPQTVTQSRPKTSHTTIERRYRTNVNAHIQSLRQAVPVLRVVDRAATIKASELYPGGDASDPDNHINARGFIDGIKIVCKRSKAVEYIRVLKNREKRLTRELEGLKILLRGLVGGTELLGEWEREGERDEASVEDDTDEDEEGESDEGRGRGRKRKKAKVAVELAPKVQVERKPAAPVQEGEKKRGRPRKIVPLLASDCVHKPTVRVILSLRNVRVVSVGRCGMGGNGNEVAYLLLSLFAPVPSPSLSFPALVPHALIPIGLGSPAIASPPRTRAVESNDAYTTCMPCTRPHLPRLRPDRPSPMLSPPFPALELSVTSTR
ncbi:hypothetical protein B0H16DRAFT_1822999 [Mycena metata]|uniref:BHLH domain-containing protein n=1 Tax=Mycena metata TaxID=1033252 RepID=A0AAD7GZ21_9AGAR|nr:hypothetical protein B0H16DRAFT_1822999 [Mycena metata]